MLFLAIYNIFDIGVLSGLKILKIGSNYNNDQRCSKNEFKHFLT